MPIAALAFVAVGLAAGALALSAPVLTDVVPTWRPLDAAVVVAQCMAGAVFVVRHPDGWTRHRTVALGLAGIAGGALVRAVVSAAVPAAFSAGVLGATGILWVLVVVSWLAGLLTAAGLGLVASGVVAPGRGRRWPPLVALALVAGALGVLQALAGLSRVAALQPSGLALQTALGGALVVLIELVAWTWLAVTAARRATLGGPDATTGRLAAAAGLVAVSRTWVIPAAGILLPALPTYTLILQSAFALVSATLLVAAFARGLPAHPEAGSRQHVT